MRTYRVTLDITIDSDSRKDSPEHWDWRDLLDIDAPNMDENTGVTLVGVTEIERPSVGVDH